MVSASDVGPEGRELEPWPVHPCCDLRQNNRPYSLVAANLKLFCMYLN